MRASVVNVIDRRRLRVVLGLCGVLAVGLTGCSAGTPSGSDPQAVAQATPPSVVESSTTPTPTTIGYSGAEWEVRVPAGVTGVIIDAIGGGGGAGGGSDATDDDGGPALGGAGGNAGASLQTGNGNPQYIVWNGDRGADGGGGGGFQGGYGANGGVTTPDGTHGGGGGGGAGSTAVWVQVADNMSIAPAPEQYRGQDGTVTLTWVTS